MESPNREAVVKAITNPPTQTLNTPHSNAKSPVINATNCPGLSNVLVEHQQLLKTPRGWMRDMTRIPSPDIIAKALPNHRLRIAPASWSNRSLE